MKRLRLAGIGCGGRTLTYFSLAAQMPEKYEVVAAADPIGERVQKARVASRNPVFRAFSSDAEILAQDRLADVMIIGTQDAFHYQPCKAALEKGYDILLEKPIATRIDQVLELDRLATRLNRRVLVCHVLRYSPFYRKVKEIISSGALGEVVSVNAVEGVGAWHQSHSYVRGHWAVTGMSSPMIVAKCCHDMDILSWLIDRPCVRVSSHGDLTYFTGRNAPAGAPARCTDGCPSGSTCIYNALQYAERHRMWLGFVYDKAESASEAEIRQWLSESPWGRCVYRCGNTAVDHQVVSLAFQGGVTATFTMTAFESGRHIEIYGTKAWLRGGDFLRPHAGCDIIVGRHESGAEERFSVTDLNGGYSGHGGGDAGLVLALHDEMNKPTPAEMISSLSKSVESHVMAFAAEESRVTAKTVELAGFAARAANPT